MEDDIDDIEIDVNQIDDEMTVVEETIIDNTNDITGNICSVITIRNNSYGNVMYSQASVCPRWGWGGVVRVAKSGAWRGGTCMVKRGACKVCMAKWSVHGQNSVCGGRGGGMRGRRVGHCSGQYASYWNVFLYVMFLPSMKIGRFLKKDLEINVIYLVVS